MQNAPQSNNAPIVIGLVGEKGGGKGTFAIVLAGLAAPCGVATVRFSDVLRATLDLWDIPKTREHLQDIAKVMVDRFGADALSHAVEERVHRTDADMIVLDGIRWQADVDLLRRFPRNILVYITAPPNIRYERLAARSENVGEGGMSYAQFLAEEQKVNEIEIPTIGAHADVRMDNAGLLEEFRVRIAEHVLPKLPAHAKASPG